MISILPCTKNKTRILRYPDFGCKRDESIETIEWKGTGLPPLDGDGWYRMKTVDADVGCVYRAEVQWVKFIRNSWTHVIRVEFDYKIEVYHDVEKNYHLPYYETVFLIYHLPYYETVFPFAQP